MHEQLFCEQLQEHIGKPLNIVINDNTQTVLSVCRERDPIKVSIHRIFLDAPKKILEALAKYISGTTRLMQGIIRQFISEKFVTLDYSHKIKAKELSHVGSIHDLQDRFQNVNQHYFNGDIKLMITWYGKLQKIQAKTLRMGLYYDSLKLIKVHRILDQEWVPSYFIEFVLYHEMLHHVYPSYVDDKGKSHIHHLLFKEKEQEFEHYYDAKVWLRENQHQFFKSGEKRSNYGRT